MISLTVNGEAREAVAGTTVERLVEDVLELEPSAVAIERNGEIAPRAHWGTTVLEHGDRLEVVRFVQGG